MIQSKHVQYEEFLQCIRFQFSDVNLVKDPDEDFATCKYFWIPLRIPCSCVPESNAIPGHIGSFLCFQRYHHTVHNPRS